MRPVLAHNGGWDELLFFVLPVAVFWLLRRLNRRKAGQENQGDDTNHSERP